MKKKLTKEQKSRIAVVLAANRYFEAVKNQTDWTENPERVNALSEVINFLKSKE